jgi:hypothetical protein
VRPGIVAEGDRAPHECDLPGVPRDGYGGLRLNAVAECSTCGRLHASRAGTVPTARPYWVRHTVVWKPLRWWHRRARRNLRRALDEQ